MSCIKLDKYTQTVTGDNIVFHARLLVTLHSLTSSPLSGPLNQISKFQESLQLAVVLELHSFLPCP